MVLPTIQTTAKRIINKQYVQALNEQIIKLCLCKNVIDHIINDYVDAKLSECVINQRLLSTHDVKVMTLSSNQ